MCSLLAAMRNKDGRGPLPSYRATNQYRCCYYKYPFGQPRHLATIATRQSKIDGKRRHILPLPSDTLAMTPLQRCSTRYDFGSWVHSLIESTVTDFKKSEGRHQEAKAAAPHTFSPSALFAKCNLYM